MKKILLLCSAGMSTSLLVTKMRQAATEQGATVDINAIAEAELKQHVDKVDVILLGPQVRFLLAKIKEAAAPYGIPVDVIDSIDYGTMNGGKVLQKALRLLGA